MKVYKGDVVHSLEMQIPTVSKLTQEKDPEAHGSGVVAHITSLISGVAGGFLRVLGKPGIGCEMLS